MAEITRMPTVIVHKIVTGGVLSGVTPSGVTYQFDYDNEAGGPFSVGETLSWGAAATAGTGTLTVLVDAGATGTITLVLATGVPPVDDMEVTGGDSSATADVDGDVTKGDVDPEEAVRRGRYRSYARATDGGLIDISEANARFGYRVTNTLISMPGFTEVNFYIVDRDGDAASAGALALTSGNGYVSWRHRGLLVPPGCQFKVVGTGTASSDGEIIFYLEGIGWGVDIFDSAPSLGQCSLPPAMERP